MNDDILQINLVENPQNFASSPILHFSGQAIIFAHSWDPIEKLLAFRNSKTSTQQPLL